MLSVVPYKVDVGVIISRLESGPPLDALDILHFKIPKAPTVV